MGVPTIRHATTNGERAERDFPPPTKAILRWMQAGYVIVLAGRADEVTAARNRNRNRDCRPVIQLVRELEGQIGL